jgi:ribosomal protein S18 acetylase RimI-like enzyme
VTDPTDPKSPTSPTRPTSPTVRAARPEDAESIADAHVRGWQAAYRGLVPDGILDGFSVERRAAYWRDTITAQGAAAATAESEAARTWVVEDAGVVCGFAASGPIRDAPADLAGAGEVFAIYLAPESRGRGLGRALFGQALDDLSARGLTPIVVWVFEANPSARRFYEAAGLRADGARQPVDFGEVAVPEIRYRLG